MRLLLILTLCVFYLFCPDGVAESQPPENKVKTNFVEINEIDEHLNSIDQILENNPRQAFKSLKLKEADLSTYSFLQLYKYQELISKAQRQLGNLDAAQRASNELFKLAKNSNNETLLARAHRQQAEIYDDQGKYEDAGSEHQKALDIYKANLNEHMVAVSQIMTSQAKRKQGKYFEAIEMAESALVYMQKVQDEDNIASAYSSIGLSHEFLGNYTQALQALNKTLSHHVKHGETAGIADALFNIASVYSNMKEWSQAREYLLKALEIDKNAGFKSNTAYDYYRLAEVEKKAGNYNQAHEYANSSLTLFKELGSQRHISWSTILLGEIYMLIDRLDDAQDFLTKGIKLARDAKDSSLITSGLMNLSSLYIQTQRPIDAQILIKEGLQDAKRRNEIEQVLALYDLQIDVYELQKNYKAALQVMHEKQAVSESRADEIKTQSIVQLQNSIAFQAKKNEISLLSKNRELAEIKAQQANFQRNVWIAGAVILLIFLVILVNKERQKKQVAHFKQELLKESVHRKNNLLADLSHELRTPLSVLSLQIEMLEHNLSDNPNQTFKELKGKITELNTLISDIYTLSKNENDMLQFTFEKWCVSGFLDHFIDENRLVIERAGFRLRTKVSLAKNTFVVFDKAKIKQVLNNLLNNSITYTNSPGVILVSSWVTRTDWVVQIEDSAPEVDNSDLKLIFERLYRCEKSRSRQKGGSGLGLAICRGLVQKHQGKISARKSELGGLSIRFSIPLKAVQSFNYQ